MTLPEPDPSPRALASPRFRSLILALIAIGAAGLLTELLLIEHFEEPWQFAPLASLVLTLIAAAGITWWPGRTALRAFQAVMIACVAFGIIGVVLHLKGNLEFELEEAPDLRGWPLYWTAIRGATPALAPGALAQLGLLGLLYSHHHPAGLPANIHQTFTKSRVETPQ